MPHEQDAGGFQSASVARIRLSAATDDAPAPEILTQEGDLLVADREPDILIVLDHVAAVRNWRERDLRLRRFVGLLGERPMPRVTANGTVYALTGREDLTGAFVQLREGCELGDQRGGRLWLRNANGATLTLAKRGQGLRLSLGSDGVLIGWR